MVILIEGQIDLQIQTYGFYVENPVGQEWVCPPRVSTRTWTTCPSKKLSVRCTSSSMKTADYSIPRSVCEANRTLDTFFFLAGERGEGRGETVLHASWCILCPSSLPRQAYTCGNLGKSYWIRQKRVNFEGENRNSNLILGMGSLSDLKTKNNKSFILK